MQRWKQIMVLFLVLLFGGNLFVYGENPNTVVVNCPIAISDSLVNQLVNVYQQQLEHQDKTKFTVEGLKEILDPKVIWKYEGVAGVIPFAGTFSKPTGIEAFWQKYLDSVAVQKMELRYYLRQGNVVHLHWTEEGTVKATGKKYAVDNVQRWEFNEQGALVKFRCYTDTFAMFEAFQFRTNKQWSLGRHTEDLKVNGDGPVESEAAKMVIEGIYNNFVKGEIPAIVNVIGPDNVLLFAGPPSIDPVAMVAYGPEGIQKWFNALFSNTEYLGFKVFTYTADGPRVDVEFEESFYGVHTGKIITMQGLHSWVVNADGKTAKIRSYNDTYVITWVYCTKNLPSDTAPK